MAHNIYCATLNILLANLSLSPISPLPCRKNFKKTHPYIFLDNQRHEDFWYCAEYKFHKIFPELVYGLPEYDSQQCLLFMLNRLSSPACTWIPCYFERSDILTWLTHEANLAAHVPLMANWGQKMTESVSSEFSSFLRLLTNDNDCRYLDDAKRLARRVKEASECGLSLFERRRRIELLSVVCRELIFTLESDRSLDYRYRIPLAVREMSLSSSGLDAKLILLGNFEIAVRRFEKPDESRPRWSDNPPAV